MTNKELIKKLSEFPDDSPINFCVFSNLTPRRCDIQDNGIMILRSPHTGDLNIMLDVGECWEKDVMVGISRLLKDKKVV